MITSKIVQELPDASLQEVISWLEQRVPFLVHYYEESQAPWNIKVPMAMLAYDLLTQLLARRDDMMGYPASLKNQAEWFTVLEKIRQTMAYEADMPVDLTPEEVNEGLTLFATYFDNLWD